METINKILENFDTNLVSFSKRWVMPVSRFAIFLVYFWFGLLKVLGESPAGPLVSELLARTMPFITPTGFIFAFGILEMLIGIIFIIPRLERLGMFVLSLHLITTIMPLFLLPAVTWSGFLVPTLEGQYIIKNILIIAVAIGIFSHLHATTEQKMV